MRRLYILQMMLLMAAAASAGNAVDAESLARSRAEQHMNHYNKLRGINAAGTLAPTLKWRDASSNVFVFAKGNNAGYVITSGAEYAAPVLGYSDCGDFDAANMPEAMRWMLDEYAREIASASGSEIKKAYSASSDTLTPVAPLLGSIAWDQQYPYNLQCPTYYGNDRSATGCVATAMAMVMYYHQYPQRGQNSNRWGQELYPLIGDLYTDFSQSEYKWADMKPQYNVAGQEDSPESCEAVAKLMADCGASVSMQYGPSSGAMGQDWAYGLAHYFGYDQGVALRWRSHYTQNEWDASLRSELDARRPVLVSGFTAKEGGHAFVFDGYDADGLYHVNWGWSAMSNGYFRSNALTPGSQGTGGSTGGFNYKQLAITGIRPPQAETEDAMEICSEEAVGAPKESYLRTELIPFRLRGKIENLGWKDVTVDFALGIYNSEGVQVMLIEGVKNIPMAKGAVQRNTTFGEADLSSLPDGCYELRPLVKDIKGKNWTRILDKTSTYTNRSYLVIDAEKASIKEFSYSKLSGEMTVQPRIAYYQKSSIKFTATNTGDTDYYGELNVEFLNPDTKAMVKKAGEIVVALAPGETITDEVVFEVMAYAGNYLLAIVDYNADYLCEPVAVTVEEFANNTTIAAAAPLMVENADEVDPMNVHATAVVKCTNGLFTDQILLYLFDGKKEAGALSPVFVVIGENEEATVEFNGAFENARPGTEYKVALIDGRSMAYITPKETASAMIRIAGTSAVESIDAAEEATYYNLQGMPVKNPSAAGLYIVRRGDKVTKSMIKN